MDEDDTEDVREAVTLVNRLTTRIASSSRKFTSKTNRQILRAQESAEKEDSDTMECASENEVENLPKDEDAPIRMRRICERSRHSLDVPDDTEFSMTRKKIATSSSLRVSDDSKYIGSRLGFFMTTRSPQSSSSQEEYEPEVKSISRLQMQQQRQQQQQQQQHLLTTSGVGSQVTARSMESLRSSRNFLSADDRYSEDSKSMESLSSEMHMGSSSRSHYRSFLTSSTRDVRKIVTVESKSSENLHREESLNAEVRRGLFANTGFERKLPQHLSLPPPSNIFSLTSPGGSDRKITILSPHLPMQTSEFQFSAQTLKSRRKKAIVLPRLVLPRSESEVFLE